MRLDWGTPSSLTNESRYTASLAASVAATNSASIEDRAMVGCFLLAHETVHLFTLKVYPDVLCRTSQLLSDIPASFELLASYLKPIDLWRPR